VTGPALVEVGDGGDLGDILVDGEGRTIYIFDNDEEGVSNCSGGCLMAWPPLLTEGDPEAGTGVTAEIGTITRSDGTTQVTVNGFPAYYYRNDAAAGDTNGHGVNNVWWVFDPAGEAQRPAKVGVAEHPTLGMILVDGEGMTLYRFDNDTAGVSNCSGGCLTAWPPLLTEFEPVALEGVNGEIGTITRSDGTMQVTVNGFPLYYWQNDEAAGDANGQGVNNIWWVVDADGETVGN
jgi:predicted lipoprotein with Yx(FWY)xxD motif